MTDPATPGTDEQKPAQPPATPGDSSQGKDSKPAETVTLSKEEHEQLVRDAARAASAQSRADRLAGIAAGKGQNLGSDSKPTPASDEAPHDDKMKEEDRKAERGLINLALDPAYREVLDASPDLRNMLTKNPLSLLPIYASKAVDAQDAIELMKEELDRRVAALKKPAPSTDTKPAETPATPPQGGVNPPPEVDQEAYEQARKEPSTDKAIAGMIRARVRPGSK